MPIPSDIYDREYFMSERCEGFDSFRENRGLSALKLVEVDLLGIGPGSSVLDAGCGRGEVLLECARRGADVAGVDYSAAAVELTRETLAAVEGADVHQADLAQLPWPDGSFDRVLMGDVIEHLEPAEADRALRELLRVLRPGGILLVHTAPNLLFRHVTWPLARLGLRALGHGKAVELVDWKLEEVREVHVNEQTLWRLRRAVRRAGFADVTAWIDRRVTREGKHFLTETIETSRLVALTGSVAGTRPLRLFLGNDLWAVGRKPGP